MVNFRKLAWKGLIYYGMFRTALWALRLTSNTLIRTFKAVQSHRSLYASKDKPSYAVITGGSGGLGFAFAHQLAAKGFNIVLIARDLKKLEGSAEKLRESYNVTVRCISFDFSDAENPNAWIKLADDLKDLDIAILVNNIGGYGWSSYEKQEEENIQSLINNCIYGTTFMTRIVLPGMLQRKERSAVISVGSFTGESVLPTTAANCAAKRYIHRLTLALARDYEDKKIDFLCLIPGLIDTPGLKEWKSGKPTLVSSAEDVAAATLSQVKTANQRGNLTHGTFNHCLFNWLQQNCVTRRAFVKRTFGLTL